jgi:hypothetical protein
MTKATLCKCKHKYQDEKYGKNMRVHNWARKAKINGGWRCTVCGDVK